MSCGKSEPAGLCGLRKQVTETKKVPWTLGLKKGSENTAVEKGGERGRHALETERVCPGSFLLRVLCGGLRSKPP